MLRLCLGLLLYCKRVAVITSTKTVFYHQRDTGNGLQHRNDLGLICASHLRSKPAEMRVTSDVCPARSFALRALPLVSRFSALTALVSPSMLLYCIAKFIDC